MHEYSIVLSLLDRVEEEARARGATSVEAIQVRIGELSGVEIDLLHSAYSLFAEHPLYGRAQLRIESVPASWVCPGCGRRFERGAILRCKKCERPARLVGGDEILLERIEMEVS